jgi:hypothetical protein
VYRHEYTPAYSLSQRGRHCGFGERQEGANGQTEATPGFLSPLRPREGAELFITIPIRPKAKGRQLAQTEPLACVVRIPADWYNRWRHGPSALVTVGSVVRGSPDPAHGVTGGGRFKFVIAEGESVDGPIPATGNTNTRGFFQPDVRTFLKRWVAAGPTHHFALGVGHHATALVRIAQNLDIEHVIVTPHEPIL